MLLLGMVVVSSVTENVGIGECFNLTSLVCSLVDRYIGDYGYWLRREHSPDRNDDDDDDGGPSGKEKSAKIIRSLLASWLAGWLCSMPVPVALSVGLGLVKDYDLCPLFRLLLHRVSCVRLELREIPTTSGEGAGAVDRHSGTWLDCSVDTIQLTTTTCGDCFPSAVLRRKR